MIDLFIHTLFSRDHFTKHIRKEKLLLVNVHTGLLFFHVNFKENKKGTIDLLTFSQIHPRIQLFSKKIEILYLKTLVVSIII